MTERVQVEELETSKPLTRELKVVLSDEAVRNGLERAAKKVSRKIRIPGFRPGRAPYYIVERYVGREYLMREFLADELEALTQEALEQAKVEKGALVDLQDLDVESPSFRLEVALPPKVDLGDYMSIRIPYEEPQVTDEDVEATLADILQDWAEPTPVEGPAQMGDKVDAVLTIRVGDQTPVEEEEVSVEVGADLYMHGLSDRLVGMKVGETHEFSLPVPEDHAWRSYGEEAQVTVEVKGISRPVVPELTEEIAKSLNPDVESPEELREIVRENLLAQRRDRATSRYRTEIIRQLEEMATVEIPPLLVEQELDAYIEQMKAYAEELGLTWEQYLRGIKMTEEALREENRPEVERTLRRDLILQTIAEEQQIEPTQEALAEVFGRLMMRGMSMEEISRRLPSDKEFRDQVVREALRISVLNFLARVARGELEAEETEEEEEEETAEEPTTVEE